MAEHTTVVLGDRVEVLGRAGILQRIELAADGAKVLHIEPPAPTVEAGPPQLEERPIQEISVFVTEDVRIKDRA